MNAPAFHTPKVFFGVLVTLAMLAGPPFPRVSASPPDKGASIQGEVSGHCGDSTCQVTAQPTVVAVALPLSGPHAAVGRSVGERVYEALGAIEGIRVVTFDTAGTVAGSERAIADAVKAGAALVVGGIGDRESAALSAAAGVAGVPLVTMGRSAMPGATTIQAVASRQSMSLALVDEVVRQGPVDCAWVIFMDNPFGEAELAAFMWAIDKRGIRLAGSSRTPPDGADEVEYVADITRQISAKRDSGACVSEILHLVMDVNDAGRLVDHLLYSGFFDKTSGSVRMTGTGLFNAPGLVAQHGSSLKGLVFVDIEPVNGEVATRADLFGMEAADFASVAAGVAGVAGRKGAAGVMPVPPVIDGLTGTLVFRDGAMVGQRTRAWKIAGRGLEFVQLPAPPASATGASPVPATGAAGDGAKGAQEGPFE